MADFNSAQGLDPNSGNAHFGLAIVYQRAGQRDKAITEYRQFLAIQYQRDLAATSGGTIAGAGYNTLSHSAECQLT
jgi:Flp pilus assembly protein TadD